MFTGKEINLSLRVPIYDDLILKHSWIHNRKHTYVHHSTKSPHITAFFQTTALVYNFIFAMSIRPDVAAKVKAEIDAQVGRDRIPNLHDREILPYTDAVLQEVIRFYPVFPLGELLLNYFPRVILTWGWNRVGALCL